MSWTTITDGTGSFLSGSSGTGESTMPARRERASSARFRSRQSALADTLCVRGDT